MAEPCVIILRDGTPCGCTWPERDASNTCTKCKHGNRWHGNAWKNSEGVYKSRSLELIQCIKAGNVEKVKEIIEAGAYLNSRDQQGITVLMEAASLGHKEVVLALLDGKADPNMKDPEGNPAIFLAQEAGQTEVVQAMTERGVNF
uniref:Uncharacterized protein n=1 Tax=Eutreptiella gymnastica TaxID=73025 RepID=A0A7S4CK59_9EUGL|eukprot:CAMPEP_0174301118 /NCGR_PEP_ID=MMETSP0809-20121228/58852_1 /TAXON_ID=73025 ORGANISM="Eutreptiella gymnastica-like, Strain CCMP1594" /NCGR_SAMPLE_ID=MMETSP0809 /ASSEMBLY_ACC=CAM_ASM_000658 /LENGTH=144 /DNA_ID=CAMNT_0015406805 /DNA_START=21 /DNA_END=455 /DNA_ORIENTATION=-